MILPIVQVWDEILTKISDSVIDLSSHLDFIKDLMQTLQSTWRWVWLAAPQVWVSLRIFVMHPRPTSSYPDQLNEWTIVVINPVLVAVSKDIVTGYEWCLSISSQNGQWMLRAEVPRHKRIDVKYQNETWEFVEKRLEWLASIIFQHEYDHLEWILFLSRVQKRESLTSA